MWVERMEASHPIKLHPFPCQGRHFRRVVLGFGFRKSTDFWCNSGVLHQLFDGFKIEYWNGYQRYRAEAVGTSGGRGSVSSSGREVFPWGVTVAPTTVEANLNPIPPGVDPSDGYRILCPGCRPWWRGG